MKLSKYAHKIRISSKYYVLYNGLLFHPLLLKKEEIDKIWNKQFNQLAQDELSLLQEEGIIISKNKQDDEVKKYIQSIMNKRKNEVNLMYLIPYGGCNLACKYCFIGKIDNLNAQKMNVETANIALNKFTANLKKSRIKQGQIIFYGGEPTLNFEIVQKISERVNEEKLPILLSMITNATSLTDEMIDVCSANKVSLGISLDGPKPVNDLNRIYKSGTESVYDVVRKKINKIKQKDVNMAISLTLSEEVIKETHFLDWIKELGVKNINFNILHYTEKTNTWREYYKNVSKFLFKAYDILDPLGIKDDRILRKFRAFYDNHIKYNDCCASGAEQITIRPNGDITICHGYWNSHSENCGNINTVSFKDIYKTDIYKRWKMNLTVNKAKCLKCPAIYICGNGCPKQSEDLFDNQLAQDKPFCLFTKYALKQLFKRHFRKELKKVSEEK